MENLFLIKSEIIMMFISLCYFCYFIIDKILFKYKSIKKIIIPKNKRKNINVKNIKIDNKEKNYKKSKNKNYSLSMEEKEKLTKIIKRVKNNFIKGYYDIARSLIIEGLAIDKYNKDLNIELAKIYEKENKFKNAEYIYSEIIENVKDATSVIKKLGIVLAAQGKYKKSIKSFEKVHKRDKSDVEVIDMLADLYYKVENYNSSLKYILLSLKDTPRNTSKLKLAGKAYENIGEYNHSIIYYNKILDLQPYNTEIRDKVKTLEKNIK